MALVEFHKLGISLHESFWFTYRSARNAGESSDPLGSIFTLWGRKGERRWTSEQRKFNHEQYFEYLVFCFCTAFLCYLTDSLYLNLPLKVQANSKISFKRNTRTTEIATLISVLVLSNWSQRVMGMICGSWRCWNRFWGKWTGWRSHWRA